MTRFAHGVSDRSTVARSRRAPIVDRCSVGDIGQQAHSVAALPTLGAVSTRVSNFGWVRCRGTHTTPSGASPRDSLPCRLRAVKSGSRRRRCRLTASRGVDFPGLGHRRFWLVLAAPAGSRSDRARPQAHRRDRPVFRCRDGTAVAITVGPGRQRSRSKTCFDDSVSILGY